MSAVTCYLSDSLLFWALQVLLIAVTFFLFALDIFHQHRAGSGGLSAVVTRSDKSMAKYYALYASVNGLLVALALSVDTAENFKVSISIFNTVCCFYIFVLNQYMRNKVVGLTGSLTKVETR